MAFSNIKTAKKMRVFYVCMIIGAILVSFISIFFNQKSFLTLFIMHKNDFFMDYFNSIRHSYSNNLYSDFEAIYPALAYIIYRFCGKMLPADVLLQSTVTYRESRNGILGFIVITIFLLIILTSIIHNFLKDTPLFSLVFINTIFFWGPFLFLIERGNILLLSLVLSVIFFCYKDSNNRVLKELAFISLAVAAAIKIYPAIFGLIMLHEKRYKEMIRCIIYGFFMAVLPFFYFEGVSSIIMFVKSITYTMGTLNTELDIGFHLDLQSFFVALTFVFGGKAQSAFIIGRFCAVLSSFLLLGFSFLYKDNWKKVMALTIVMVILPGFNYYYAAAFYIVPLVLFFKQKTHFKRDWIYLVPLTLMLLPLAIGDYTTFSFIASPYPITMDTFVCNVMQLCLIILLLLEGVILIKKKYFSFSKNKNRQERINRLHEGKI